MKGNFRTADQVLRVECDVSFLREVLEGVLEPSDGPPRPEPTMTVRIEATREPFGTSRWTPLTRGVLHKNGQVAIRDAATSGFDLHLRVEQGHPTFTFRWRPPTKSRAASYAMRSRWLLLARAVLVQYPAMWWSGVTDGAPIHAPVCSSGIHAPLMAGPGGVGKSTLLLRELQAGAQGVSDNLCVVRDRVAWGVVEPMRVDDGHGRKTTHGRREVALPNRVPSLRPDCVVVLSRSHHEGPSVMRACDTEVAWRWIVSGTYMAGELRRYWPFAATLAAGTGLGPPHPPVAVSARALATALPCFSLALGESREVRLADVLPDAGVIPSDHLSPEPHLVQGRSP